jgi:hypothetical protein
MVEPVVPYNQRPAPQPWMISAREHEPYPRVRLSLPRSPSSTAPTKPVEAGATITHDLHHVPARLSAGDAATKLSPPEGGYEEETCRVCG